MSVSSDQKQEGLLWSPQLGETRLAEIYLYLPNIMVSTDINNKSANGFDLGANFIIRDYRNVGNCLNY